MALVPARGGSKGIPRKNLSPLAGKPLIAWSIEEALASVGVERVVVTTDDREIAEVSRHYGAHTPFLRPAELAQDDTPTIDAVLHAVEWLEEHEGYTPDYVLLLQVTSPMRIADDIDEVVSLAADKKADTVVSLTLTHSHPYWMMSLDEEQRLSTFMGFEFRELATTYGFRQNLPSAYSLNGALYLVRRTALLENRSLYGESCFGYVMPEERSMDIDKPLDLAIAEVVLRARE